MSSASPPRRAPVVGLMLPTAGDLRDGTADPGRLLRAARRAEAAGFDGVYVGDHLLHPRPLLESVVSLAAVAATTERVALGPCVMLAALRQPLVLAKQLATLACFAPGRLRVGIGVGGEYPVEFDAAGVPLPERGRRTEEALRQLRALVAGQPVPVGTDGDQPVVAVAPTPHDTVPFLLAGRKDVALRRAAAHGDGWIGYLLTPPGFARRRGFLLECRSELRRPAESFTTGMVLPVHLTADGAGARAAAAGMWAALTANGASFPEQLFVAGPPDEIVDQLHTYWSAGCTEMVLALADQGDGFDEALDTLAEAVVPRVRAFD